jgi:flagellin-like hook-associated protein FlgL
MRANLLSLQQTADLMGTTQNRLATGKRVNSALDGPVNYFAAQSLSNRAADISALLDGMGQAIQSIKAASEGIDAAKKVVEQMKSVANTAAQTASDAVSATTAIEATGRVDVTRQLANSASSAANSDNVTLLTNLNNFTTGAKLGVLIGQTLEISTVNSGVHEFTVAEDSTMNDLQKFVDDLSFDNAAGTGALNLTGEIVGGKFALFVSKTNSVANADDITIGGNMRTVLGLGTSITGSSTANTSVTGSLVIGSGPSYLVDNDAAHRLTAMTDVSGSSIGLEYGDTLTVQQGPNGAMHTFYLGFDDTQSDVDSAGTAGALSANEDAYGITAEDLDVWLDNQTQLTGSITSTGQLKIATANATTIGYTLGGSVVTKLGMSSSVAGAGGTSTGTTKMYVAEQSNTPYAETTTLIRDLSRANGQVIRALAANTTVADDGNAEFDLAPGETITVQTTTGTDTIRLKNGWTVQNTLDAINAADAGLTVTINGQGNLVVDNQTAGVVTFAGTVGTALFNAAAPQTALGFAVNTTGNEVTATATLYGAYQTKGGGTTNGVPSDTYIKQYDTLHSQLDKLVQDASYQGTNLISSEANSPMKVVFNEEASNANKLEVASVDMTTTGLGIAVATANWSSTSAVETAIESLTGALTALRNQSSNFGQNLTLVQTRQDFANNIIATLNEGADKLTLADMNEEGANMLALQTRSQLGTQSLALASQANASVLRLFG